MQCKKKKPKIRIPQGLLTGNFGMTFSSYKNHLLHVLDTSTNPSYAHSCSYSLLVFICVESSLIQGTGTSTAMQDCGCLCTKTEGSQQRWRKEHFSLGEDSSETGELVDLLQRGSATTVPPELHEGRERSDIAPNVQGCCSHPLNSCFMFHYPQYQSFPKPPVTVQVKCFLFCLLK